MTRFRGQPALVLAGIVAAALAAPMACSVERAEDDDHDVVSTQDAGSTACFEGVAPSFEQDVVPILEGSCVQGSHCHSALNYLPNSATGCRGGVALVDIPIGGDGCPELSLIERLLDEPATQCAKHVPLVLPCDPDGSYLIRKIRGGSAMCDGDPMPLDADLPPGSLATLEAWILSGAPSATRPAHACAVACN